MSFLNVYQRRSKMDLTADNQWLPSTPAKSTPLSHICDESLVISTPLSERVSFAVSIPDEESATMNNAAPLSESDDINDKLAEFSPSFGIPTPGKEIPLRLNSPIYAETLIFAPPQEEDIETVTHSQCYDLNDKLIESLPVFATSALRDNKRKAGGHNYVATPKKKKKVYWPKVKGQIKRKTTPKVPNESKTKREHVFMVNGANKNYKRTQKSKSRKESKEGASKVVEDKFNRTSLAAVQDELISTLKEDIISEKGPLHSKRESCKRSLTFEPEENFEKPIPVQDELKVDSLRESCKRSLIFQPEENYEKPLHMQDELDELGFRGDSLPIMRKKIPQKRINLSCPLLTKIRRMKLKIPRRKRSKIQKKRIQYRELSFLYIKERELPFQWNKKRKRSYYAKGKINLDSLIIICNPKRKRMKKAKKSEANDERKGKTRRKMKKPSKEMNDLVNKFQSLNLTKEVPCKNQVSYKGRKKVGGVKVNTELISYRSQNGESFPFKGKVKLDSETAKQWNLLMHGKSDDEDEGNREYWEQERSIFSGRVDAFIARMHNFLGNRSFLPWKGSVLDSVIGVFLTQNVSDHLSSSAYMCLASTFPIKTFSEERKNNIPLLKHETSSESCTTNNSLNLGNKKLYSPGMVFGKKKSISIRKKGDQTEQERKMKEDQEAEEEDKQYWESLRREYIQYCTPRNNNHTDSVDWEAVRCADVDKVAKAIEGRGQHNMIAQRIQALLNKLVEMHGSMDLEWLRHAPPKKVKDYLLKVYGLGLKSVECIRLLALKQVAFPVDVNVGRIAVRLGWVPLEPLPGSVEFHMLDEYPVIDMVQQYLWPRLCTLDQPTLYQLHYHLITFGKVFCTKRRPNCKACPMRGECKHFASAVPSPTFALPQNNADGRPNNSSMRSDVIAKCLEGFSNPLTFSNVNDIAKTTTKQCEPIIDLPASPSRKSTLGEIEDVEDSCKGDDYFEEFSTLKLDKEHLKAGGNYFELNDMENSNVVVAYDPNRASKFMPKLKCVARLRTKRMVYVLPDTHPLLNGFPRREDDDPSNYLLVMWTQGELKEEPCEAAQNQSRCSNNNCFSCNKIKEEGNWTVPGTILVPCRTATNGRFPLNGTYFQVNEVFADADSSQHPIDVPTSLLWNLDTRIAYFGTSTSNIIRNSSLEEIQDCFWRGFLCVRGWDRKIGAARPLSYRFHCKTADQLIMKKKRQRDNQDLKANQSEELGRQRDDQDLKS